MCGICGFVSLKPVQNGERILQRMIEALRHRGPDGCGVWVGDTEKRGNGDTEKHAYIGHTRLAIIDLSEAGKQPMPNEDGSIWVSYNGEIYNFLELRSLLEQKGHRFRSRTDTEVLVHAYEEWGDDFATKLRGMFAFAVWDSRQRTTGLQDNGTTGLRDNRTTGQWDYGITGQRDTKARMEGQWSRGQLSCGRLLLARDRLGIKPLFYAHLPDGTLVFASELSAILKHPSVSREIDPLAVDAYFAYGYIPAPLTIYRDVRKLPPAHYLVWENGEIKLQRYWQLDFTKKRTESADELAEELRERLKETVRLHLISDVPLGAFLSGGMDSSSIVALMAQVSDRPVKTFSIGFDDEKFNELPYARLIAQRYGTEHHEFIVEAPTASLMPDLIGYFGEPFADSSALPTFIVSKIAREHVTVVLSGDGGDEIFAGYEWTRRALLWTSKPQFQSPVTSRQSPDLWHEALIRHGTSFWHRLLKAWRDWKAGPIATFQRRTKTPSTIRQLLYSRDLLEALNGQVADYIQDDLLRNAPVSDWREMFLYCDTMLYLPDDCLTKVDRMSMAVALEVRPPLLDHTVVEFAASLPFDFKWRNGTTKWLLKQAMRNDLPPETMRQRKQGFSIPVAKWMRGSLGDEVAARVNNCDRFLNPESVRKMIALHREGKANFGHLLWRVYVWGVWGEMVRNA
jgi:asparagine synthase (glutamine-hydrolysing)